MEISFDPVSNETAALFGLADSLQGKSVLEIGCGDGRLTWRYASGAARVVGIDPNDEKVAKAIQDTPASLAGTVEFLASDLSQFTQTRPSEPFDLAILSWSL